MGVRIVPLCKRSPIGILNLLLYKLSQINAFVKLIGLGPRVADPPFIVELLCHLPVISVAMYH